MKRCMHDIRKEDDLVVNGKVKAVGGYFCRFCGAEFELRTVTKGKLKGTKKFYKI